MRNPLIARCLLALGLAASASAAPAAAQGVAKGHVHTGLTADYVVHHGDKVWFRGQREVGAREVIEGDVVVASGSLRVVGEVHGDAVVGNGDLVLEPGSVVYGDAVVTGGQLVNNGGSVLGKVQQGGPSRNAGAATVKLRVANKVGVLKKSSASLVGPCVQFLI